MKKPIRPIHGTDRNNYPRVLDRVHDILNQGVTLGGSPNNVGFSAGIDTIPGNIDGVHVKVQADPVANTEFAVTHNLNRIPTGFIVVLRNNNGNCYIGGTSWTKTQIFLKCDVAGTQFTLLIY